VSEIESRISNLEAIPNNVSNETPTRQTFKNPIAMNENKEEQNSDEDSILGVLDDQAII